MATPSDPSNAAAAAAAPKAHELLDKLYQLTDDPLHWPALVETLLRLLDASTSAADEAVAADEERFLAWLSPHVQRVLSLHQRQLAGAVKEDFLAAFVEQQPVALALCDHQGNIRWMSRQLADALEHVPAELIQRIVQSDTPKPSFHDLPTRDGERKVVRVDVPALGPGFCALMLNTHAPLDLDAQQLAQLYGLTPTEISITRMLAQGINAEDIARANDTAVATVRSQIKKAMAKLGVSRQAELVATLHGHTARVHFDAAPDVVVPSHALPTPLSGVHSVLGFRGAQIAYNIVGPSDGLPLLFFHSWAGSRLQAMQSSAFLYQHGIKLVAFDRLGMGGSVPASGAPPLPLVDMVVALADHLRIGAFSVLGYSLGSLYALQCAAALPERIQQVFLVCPVAPVRGLGDLKGVLPSGKLMMGLAMKAPLLAHGLVKLWMAQMRRTPALYLTSVLPHLPPSDANAMARPEVQAQYVASLIEAIKQGDSTLLSELDDMVQDWAHHRGVRQHTIIWHGMQDCHVPYTSAERLAAEMPLAQLHGIEGAGHFLVFHHWQAIVAAMKYHAERPLSA